MKITKVEEISEERYRQPRANNINYSWSRRNRVLTNLKMRIKPLSKFFETLEETDKKPSFPGMDWEKRCNQKSINENRIKKAIFNKLIMLKGKDEFKEVAVTKDLTEPERNVVKMWSDKAKDRNKKNEDEKGDYGECEEDPETEPCALRSFQSNPILNE